MINDTDYNEALFNIIDTESVNAEYAVSAAAESFSAMFEKMDDAYMKARYADVRDISDRIINNLITGDSKCTKFEKENVIVCADDLAPSETILLDKSKVLGFVTAFGSTNSHTAILARNMNIPAIMGVGEEFLRNIKEGDSIIVDGFTGEVFTEPDFVTTERLILKQREEKEKKRFYQTLKGKENVTLDGKKIDIFANIESDENIDSVILNDAGGVGLFRSEFLYMNRRTYPTEEEQFRVYKNVLERMAEKKVIIRTLDIGADKQVDYFGLGKEENPALGCRAIRFCLTRPEVLKTQLRALFRASVYGNLGIMFPMIASVEELDEALGICEDVKKELKAEGKEYSDHTETGVMIETPSAAIISDLLAPMVDFFSVGTNDLTQYTLACDRQNPNTVRFCNPHHEAVLRLIALAAKNAHKNGIRIGICGELGADESLTEEFLRLGIDELSVTPGMVLRIRDRVRNIDLSKTKADKA